MICGKIEKDVEIGSIEIDFGGKKDKGDEVKISVSWFRVRTTNKRKSSQTERCKTGGRFVAVNTFFPPSKLTGGLYS